MSKITPIQSRLWRRVTKTDTCWIWQGFVTPKGYGLLSFVNQDGKPSSMQAHRVSYEEAFGPVAPGMVLDHICHNPACVRPDHLRQATTKQNAENRLGAQKNNKSSGVRGVYWHARSEKWRAMTRHDQKLIHLGLFSTVAEAESAVIAKRNELFTHNDLDRVAA